MQFHDSGTAKVQIMALRQVICTKVRDGDKRIVRLKEGEPRGRHVVIVDDLVQSGGTLIECQKLLTSQVGRRSCTLPPFARIGCTRPTCALLPSKQSRLYAATSCLVTEQRRMDRHVCRRARRM